MKLHRYVIRAIVLACVLFPCMAAAQPTEIMLVATDHFQQVYKPGNPNTDILSTQHQAEIAGIVRDLARFKPELVLVERLPESQAGLDSLYRRYYEGGLDLAALPDARAEVYQIGFRLAKRCRLSRVHAVNAPGGSSQSMLDNGEGISIYIDSTRAIRKLAGNWYQQIAAGSMRFDAYLRLLNTAPTYNMIYRLRYITPARVMHGTFKDPDPMVDTAFLINRYIGAELSAIFKRRDYMIYSNIVHYTLQERPGRILLLIGTAHIGSLRSIFQDDPQFRIVDAGKVLR